MVRGQSRTIGKMILFVATLTLLASAPGIALANAPGGAYIQCDPHNPSSPIRCKPDEW